MKSAISVLIAIVIMFSVCGTAPKARAGNTATFSLEITDQEPMVGESFYVMVKLFDNSGFAALQMTLGYDSNIIQLDAAEKGGLLSGNMLTSVNTSTKGKVNLVTVSNENIAGDGAVLVLTFKAVADGASDLDLTLQTYADKNAVSLDSVTMDDRIAVGQGFDEQEPSEPDHSETDTPDTELEDKADSNADTGDQDAFDTDLKPDSTNGSTQTEEEVPKATMSFTDVPEDHWAYSDICNAVETGLFSGIGENRFAPGSTMTRAMFVTVLYRYAGASTSEKQVFSDVPLDTWYSEAVTWAYENQIVGGVGDNRFDPNTSITRGQIVTILCRYCNGSGQNSNLLFDYADGVQVELWAKNGMIWALENGIITGRQGMMLASRETATRAEAATIFARLAKCI